MSRAILFCVVLAGLTTCSSASAQSPSPAPAPSLEVTVGYDDGKQKQRKSHGGVIPPVGVVTGQRVVITLQFGLGEAGQQIAVTPLDGGTIDKQQPATIGPDGAITFRFKAPADPGMHRIYISGRDHYEMQLYVFDPAASHRSR